MSPDRSYIMSFSFLVLFAFFVLLWMLRSFAPSSEVANQEQPLLDPATSVADPFITSGDVFQVPEVLASDPMIGSPDARVTLIQFSDFECPFCREAHNVVMEVQKAYADDMRVVWKDFPLPQHERARALAFAARCAEEQGKFWEFANAAFQSAIETQIPDSELLKGGESIDVAKRLDLDLPRFQQCVEENRYEAAVRDSINQGIRAELSGVPYLFVNDRPIAGLPTREQLEALVKDVLSR